MNKLKKVWGKMKGYLVEIFIRYFAMIVLAMGTVWLLVEIVWTIININAYRLNSASHHIL